MKVFLYIFLSLSVLFSIFGDSVRQVRESDFVFQPHSQEGYFQGWNYSFVNSEYQIFVTALVSNLGPNSLNNGVSISIESAKTGSFFVTKEFGEKDLQADKKKFGIKIYNNSFEKQDNAYTISVHTEELKLLLKYEKPFLGMTLSGEKYFLSDGHFVRADIPFSYTLTQGYLDWKGEVIPLKGLGGMEHLLTNYEVYKFSKRWEMLRSISSDGFRFFTGGFHGKQEDSYFRKVAIQDKKGNIIFSKRILKSETIQSQKEPFSGYILPYKEKVYTSSDDSCGFVIEYKTSAGRIKVLENISQILRFFVRLFFANPYIVNFHVKISSECNDFFPTPKIWTGIKSDYLINSK
jgi:hypothetical protein